VNKRHEKKGRLAKPSSVAATKTPPRCPGWNFLPEMTDISLFGDIPPFDKSLLKLGLILSEVNHIVKKILKIIVIINMRNRVFSSIMLHR
jgi:hypothetical protein